MPLALTTCTNTTFSYVAETKCRISCLPPLITVPTPVGQRDNVSSVLSLYKERKLLPSQNRFGMNLGMSGYQEIIYPPAPQQHDWKGVTYVKKKNGEH